VQRGGQLNADKLAVGERGRGDLHQLGGVTSVHDMTVGAQPGGQGRVTIDNGQLQVRDGGSIVVGDKGDGSVILNNASGTPPIMEVPANSGASLSIRTSEKGRGQLKGFGDVRITGPIIQNGRVVAQNGELDLSTASNVTSTIENPASGGEHGWYAERGGSVVLPPVPVTASDADAVWGEDPNDPVPDLVNSVRVTMHGVTQPGEALISLLAEDHGEVPTIPSDEQFIGIWEFDRRSLEFASGQLTIRYDDSLLRDIGGDELALQIWIYDGAWTMVPGPLTITDPLQNFIGGQIDGDTQFFAVSMTDLYIPGGISVPEPSSALLAAAFAGARLLRRRRR
jgi:hypothetical protein